jgi:hypothetical protein
MNDALLNSLIQSRNCLAESLLCGLFISLCKAFTESAQLAAQARGIAAITGGSLFRLTGAFQRRKMVCHLLFTFVFLKNIPVASEVNILRELFAAGQTAGHSHPSS